MKLVKKNNLMRILNHMIGFTRQGLEMERSNVMRQMDGLDENEEYV